MWTRVELRWEDYPLKVRYLAPGEALTVGDEGDVIADGPRRDLVTVEPGRVRVVLGDGVELVRAGARGSSPYRGAWRPHEVALVEPDSVELRVGACLIAVRVERATPRVARRLVDRSFVVAFGLSVVASAALVVGLASASPALDAAAPEEGIGPERLRTIQQFLTAAAEAEQVESETEQLESTFDSSACVRRSRPIEVSEVVCLADCCSGSWCGEEEPPPEPSSWGDALAPCEDDDGEGLPGVGELSANHDSGPLGSRFERLQRRRLAPAPRGRLEAQTPSVSGRLPAEVVQRVVRRHEDDFLRCYEAGLTRNPHLMGRVVVRFVIDSDGVVSVARNGGSDLPDSGVNVCVTERLSTLRFPAPERGIVQALYTFQFAPEPRAVRRGRE